MSQHLTTHNRKTQSQAQHPEVASEERDLKASNMQIKQQLTKFIAIRGFLGVVDNTALVEAPRTLLCDFDDLDVDCCDHAPIFHLAGHLVQSNPQLEHIALVGDGHAEGRKLGLADPALVVGEDVVLVLDINVDDCAVGACAAQTEIEDSSGVAADDLALEAVLAVYLAIDGLANDDDLLLNSETDM